MCHGGAAPAAGTRLLTAERVAAPAGRLPNGEEGAAPAGRLVATGRNSRRKLYGNEHECVAEGRGEWERVEDEDPERWECRNAREIPEYCELMCRWVYNPFDPKRVMMAPIECAMCLHYH